MRSRVYVSWKDSYVWVMPCEAAEEALMMSFLSLSILICQLLELLIRWWTHNGFIQLSQFLDGTNTARLRLSREKQFYFVLFRVKSIPESWKKGVEKKLSIYSCNLRS